MNLKKYFGTSVALFALAGCALTQPSYDSSPFQRRSAASVEVGPNGRDGVFVDDRREYCVVFNSGNVTVYQSKGLGGSSSYRIFGPAPIQIEGTPGLLHIKSKWRNGALLDLRELAAGGNDVWVTPPNGAPKYGLGRIEESSCPLRTEGAEEGYR
jgi:hypothetical protein